MLLRIFRPNEFKLQ